MLLAIFSIFFYLDVVKKQKAEIANRFIKASINYTSVKGAYYQREFIEFAIAKKALCFGEYKLKSGRISPYFFNTGLCNDGLLLSSLTKFYCNSIISNKINFDLIILILHPVFFLAWIWHHEKTKFS